jgi:hypothetical protein
VKLPATAEPAPSARIFRVIWIVGYLIGTSTHIADLAFGGADTYAGFPGPLRLFWISLVLLDPLIVVLLILRQRAGVVLGVVVIVVDVAVNSTVYATLGGISVFGIVNQALFGVVVLVSAARLWEWFGSPRAGAPGEKPSVRA